MNMKYHTRVLIIAAIGLLALGCSIDDSSLKVGMEAPSLRTKTLQDVGGDFSRITTYRYPDERMYKTSLDQALKTDKPVIVEFATPGHCTVCDKQLQMLKALLTKYEKDVIFVHLDQYQNPEAFKAFGVIGDPWTYLIDASNTVRFKQAGRMLYNELDMVIAGILREQSDTAADKVQAVQNEENEKPPAG